MGRLVNVFIDPKPAFADIAARPRWWVPMVLIALCFLGYALVFSSHVGWDHTIRQQFESEKRTETLSPEQRERELEARLKFGPPFGTAMMVVVQPVMMLITAGALLLVFNVLMGAAAKFKQVLAVAAYASLPALLALGGGLLVMFLKDPSDFDLQNPAGYNLGFYLDPKPAWLHSLGACIDVFAFWGILLLATGMAAVTKKRWSSALTGVLIPWGVFVILRVGAAAISG